VALKLKTAIQKLKAERNGKRFYVARRFNYVAHVYKDVTEPGALEHALLYFKAQGRGTFSQPNELCEAVCSVSRFGQVSFGCFKPVENCIQK
jgi:hypothetical protein